MNHGSLKEYVRRPEYRPEEQIPQIVCDDLRMTAWVLIAVKILGLANGIAYLHSLEITHGDIKPVRKPISTETRTYRVSSPTS
jgi:serine/threonine protein kinase